MSKPKVQERVRARWARLLEAFEVLSDPELRSIYQEGRAAEEMRIKKRESRASESRTSGFLEGGLDVVDMEDTDEMEIDGVGESVVAKGAEHWSIEPKYGAPRKSFTKTHDKDKNGKTPKTAKAPKTSGGSSSKQIPSASQNCGNRDVNEMSNNGSLWQSLASSLGDMSLQPNSHVQILMAIPHRPRLESGTGDRV